MFVDRVTLSLSAGKGGNGAIAWRREKFIPKGGPAGGDGGNGGSITLIADPEILSLENLRNRRIIKAQNGQMGSGSNCHGKNGVEHLMEDGLALHQGLHALRYVDFLEAAIRIAHEVEA